MKSNSALILFFSLILTSSYLTTVHAVTDAELEAIEKQIEQIEAEKKKKVDVEAKRKAEQKLKAIAEAKKEEEKKIAANKRSPRLLAPTPHKFTDMPQELYNNPSLANSPAP